MSFPLVVLRDFFLFLIFFQFNKMYLGMDLFLFNPLGEFKAFINVTIGVFYQL